MISEVSAITSKDSKTKLSKESLEEISKVINEERTRLYEKKKVNDALEGLTPEERAKIIADYLAKKSSN